MATLATCSMLIGFVLGRRYKVFILVPIVGLVIGGTVVISLAQAADASVLTLRVLTASSFVELGYVVGGALLPRAGQLVRDLLAGDQARPPQRWRAR